MQIAKQSRSQGTLETVVGTGQPGDEGDGGAAIHARLNEPKSLALDAQGGLYIADAENHKIRRVDLRSGIICTVAGCRTDTGEQSGHVTSLVEGLEDDPLADPPAATPQKFTQQTDLSGTVRFVVGAAPKGARCQGDGGPATEATLHFPSAVAVDAHALYIADTMNHRIRKVDLQSGTITTLAGNGQHRFSGDGGPAPAASLNEPCALAVDGRGHLYVADQSNNRVRRIRLEDGTITTVAGNGEAAHAGDGGPAQEASLAGPSGLAIGPDGALYVADTFNGRIRRVDPDTGVITTVVGDGGEYRYGGRPSEFSTSLSRPYGIAVGSDGNILITDSDSHLIRRWDRQRKIIGVLAGDGEPHFSGDGLPAQQSGLNYPFGVTVDSAGNVFIADTFNHRIRMIAA